MDKLLHWFAARPGLGYGGALLAVYLAVVRYHRYKRINHLLKKYPDPTLPLRDLNVAREVAANFSEFDFPYMNVVSLEIAIVKTYAVPTMSKVMYSTRQFSDKCLKRTDDTTLLITEFTEQFPRNARRVAQEGKEDPVEVENDIHRAEEATKRVNFIHSHYPILQDDFLYTLALFMLDPPEFVDKYDWRESTELEKNALFAAWKHYGTKLTIENIPDTRQELKKWTEEYEKRAVIKTKWNIELAESSIQLLLTLVPRLLHPFVRQAAISLMHPTLRKACGIVDPPRGTETITYGLLRLRALFIRYFMFPRRVHHIRTGLRANDRGVYVPLYNKYEPIYPEGYKIQDLGPARYFGKCPGPHGGRKQTKHNDMASTSKSTLTTATTTTTTATTATATTGAVDV